MSFLNLIPPIRIPTVVLTNGLLFAPLLLTLLGSSMQLRDYMSSLSFLRAAKLVSPWDDTFDFIVVGGGTAGAVVAARLSETNAKVLLIEAGGNPNPLSYIPAATPVQLDHPSTDWQYKTVPQNGSGLGLLNQEVKWPRGKGLGGSSNVNFMIYMNGNRQDFDLWAEHSGDSRWRYNNLEKYFRKIEDYAGAWEGSGVHGKEGPLRIEPVKYHPGLGHVLEAAQELGYEIRDMNFDQKQGFAPLDFTIKRGFRFSTFLAYLLPAMQRPNLSIFRYAMATKIHFDDTMRAVGVSYFRHGVQGYASATKEVIVCGGSINSPQLLLLSGIGPKLHLQEFGIQPLRDLPVGENLQDHVTTGAVFIIDKLESSFIIERDMTVNSVFDYIKRGVGPLSVPAALMGVGMASTSGQSPEWPDILFLIESLGASPLVIKLLTQMFGAHDTLVQDYIGSEIGSDAHVVLVVLGLPKSRGYIKLRSRNAFDKPIINPRYFSDPNGEDIRRLTEGLQIITKLYENTTTFGKLNAHSPYKSVPGCEQHEFKSREYFECHIRLVTLTLYHPSGTNSMGRPDSANSVVDSQLRVIGTKGLRVADASIMPFVTNANTNSPTIVIGEMCADMVKKTWKLS